MKVNNKILNRFKLLLFRFCFVFLVFMGFIFRLDNLEGFFTIEDSFTF